VAVLGVLLLASCAHMRDATLVPPPIASPVDSAQSSLPQRVGTLRVGLPGRGRANLLFDCSAPVPIPRLSYWPYEPDSLDPGSHRWLRGTQDAFWRQWDSTGKPEPAVTPMAVFPDTLILRFYDDVTDQEIALERHEVDVAVFWPGELPARMRADPRWRDAERGLRSRGVLGCVATGSDTLPGDPAEMAALNREAFGGDLQPWSELEPVSDSTGWAAARYEVDPALPGARLIGRVLARAGSASVARTLRLRYLDVPVAARDAVLSSWRTRGVTPLFAVRCPVLATPEARTIVKEIGAGAFADLVSCTGGAGK
jgi:hypothetical protein